MTQFVAQWLRARVVFLKNRVEVDARKIDVTSAAARRRFYLDRALRKNSGGAGSDMAFFMAVTAHEEWRRPDDRAHARRYCGLFDRGACGFGVSAGANDERYQLFRRRRSICYGDRSPGGSGWKRIRDLIFPTAKLGLVGSLWSPPDDGVEIDILSSDHAWAHAAFDAPISRDQTGERVIPLAFLVLMKLDAARGIDQSDINRILGRLSPEAVEEVVSLVGRFYDDSAAADDIRQSAAIGRWEYETPS